MKKLLIFFCVSLLSLYSCSNENKQEQEPTVTVNDVQKDKTEEVVNTAFEVSNEPDTEDEIIQEAEQEVLPQAIPEIVSFTSGMPCTKEEQMSRPIAVMYNNNKVSYPQNAISSADIVYECDAEGGVTRLMAIFSDWKKLGEIGSVRSARDYFVLLSGLHDAIYINAGGSPSAYSALKTNKIDYVDGVNMNDLPSGLFYRSNSRIRNNGYEHSLMTDGENIAQAVDFCGYNVTHDDSFASPLSFSYDAVELSGSVAESVTLMHSSYITVKFEYDSDLGVYSKYSFDAPHTDGLNGEQLKFKNLLVLFVNQKVVDSEGRLDIDVTSGGDGFYFVNGKCIEITWSKDKSDSSYVFKADGEEMFLSPGKTHITLFNKNHKENITIK